MQLERTKSSGWNLSVDSDGFHQLPMEAFQFASGLRPVVLTRSVPEAVRRNMAKRYLNSRGNCNTPDWGISFVAPELSFFCIVLARIFHGSR